MRLSRGTFAFSFAFLLYWVKRILQREAVVSHVRGLFKLSGCGTAQTDMSRKKKGGGRGTWCETPPSERLEQAIIFLNDISKLEVKCATALQ